GALPHDHDLGHAVELEVGDTTIAVAAGLPQHAAREVDADGARECVGRAAADQLGSQVAVEVGDAGQRPVGVVAAVAASPGRPNQATVAGIHGPAVADLGVALQVEVGQRGRARGLAGGDRIGGLPDRVAEVIDQVQASVAADVDDLEIAV